MGYQPLGSRYLLEEPIGQGGMGVVWRGRDRVTGDVCAIKVLRPELAADPDAVTRFVRERTALVKFRHPNVVTLRDMIVEGDCLALVMDLVEGGDLGSYRQSGGGTLPAADALRVSAQICDALAAAHTAGIVHRDLKPANVLLDAGQARLADFGIARVAGESPATTTGMVIGTIGFMSPEVIKGEEPSPACDVYAVGITLYELLTGAQPFTGQAVAVMRSHLDVRPARPDAMPDRMWALISACLNKEPAGRPSAAIVARALRDPVLHSEAALFDQARAIRSGPYGLPPRATEGTPSGQVAYGRPPGAFSQSGAFNAPPRSGPVTASVRLAAMAPPASGAVPVPGAMTGTGAAVPGAVAMQTGAPPTDAGWGGPALETEVGYLGVGAPGQGVGAPGEPPAAQHRGSRRGPRRSGVSPFWAAAAAVVLLLVGGGATYLATSGPAQGKTAGASASPAVAASLGDAAASAGVTSPAASRSASPSSSAHASAASGQPSATAAATRTQASQVASQRPSTQAPTPTAAAPSPPEPTGPNLVGDGDFTGSISDWDNYVTGTVIVNGGVGGGDAAQMTGPSVGVSQIVTGLTPGQAYELTGWAMSEDGGETYIGAKNYDDTGDHSNATTASSWSALPYSFTEGAGHTTVEIYCWRADAGIGYCSNISLRALG